MMCMMCVITKQAIVDNNTKLCGFLNYADSYDYMCLYMCVRDRQRARTSREFIGVCL